ncbi:MAG TPA: hypothetical protein PKE58_15810 [Acidobacteriota bacterium]|nr:hypothetical protein [Acidobacteriota bacterium]
MKKRRKNKYGGSKSTESLVPPGQNSLDYLPSSAKLVSESFKVIIPGVAGSKRTFDFGPIAFGQGSGVPRPEMARSLAIAFTFLNDVSNSTRNSYFTALREFVKFLDSLARTGTLIVDLSQIDYDVLELFKITLWQETKRQLATRRGIFEQFRGLLKSFRKVMPDTFGMLPLHLPQWKGQSAKLPGVVKEVIEYEQLLAILTAAEHEQQRIATAYGEIIATLRRAEQNENALHKGNGKRPKGYWLSQENAVWEVLVNFGVKNVGPTGLRSALNRGLQSSRKKIVSSYIPCNSRALLADGLVLAIRLGINPSSIATLNRDCLMPSPLRGYSVVEFDKPRAGTLRGKMVVVEDNGAVTKTIRDLLKRTNPLLPYLKDTAIKRLFIFRRLGQTKRGIIGVLNPGQPFPTKAIAAFVKDHSDCCGIRSFTMHGLRAAVATSLYERTGDLLRIKRLLQHSTLRATIQYLRGRALALKQDREIVSAISENERRLQESIDETIVAKKVRRLPVVESLGQFGEWLGEKVRRGEVSEEAKNTALERGVYNGFVRCTQPWDAPWPEVPKGTVCTSLGRCLDCPNAIIFEEDHWKVLRDLRKLNDERQFYSTEDWLVLYGERHLILNQINRRFSMTARNRAESQLMNIPKLENLKKGE